MANVATMGPPPSPKEPRRSGRRTAPSASSSKSPAGSPTSDTAPKPKESAPRPPPPPPNSSRSKRHKQEDHDGAPEDAHKAGTNGKGNARANRKGKEKEKPALTVDTTGGEDGRNIAISGTDSTADPEEDGEDGEEQGVTRCICDDGDDPGEFMAQCEICKTWQHGQCMGYTSEESLPEQYYCEQCRPDLYPELLKKHARKVRQASTHSHHPSSAGGRTSRSPRSHSPLHHLKQPTKRRNTMNSRDAAYEESFQALIEATAAEAAAHEANMKVATVNGLNGATNGHVEVDQDNAAAPKKRKRSGDDAVPTKRTRSASTGSDRPPLATITGDANPVNGGNTKTASAPNVPTSKNASRNKRAAAGNRKAQAQELGLEEEAGSTPGPSARRQASSTRVKATTANEHGNRRVQGSAGVGPGANASSHVSAAAASRAYHNTHAYAVSQQPLFTTWGLPDYLAHLEPMLPTDVPRPLEVRGSGIDPSGRESLERITERGVKVKWPSKRMSVGDMNKRVRALVEWVGREQATALERSRRREAVEKSLALEVGADHRPAGGTGPAENGEVAALDGAPITESPSQEKKTPPLESAAATVLAPAPSATLPESGSETMKMMEELMEELIRFQERFGPGAKTKERERRTVTV